VWEVEPFVRVGYWRGRFEFIATFAIGIPLNQDEPEEGEEEFALAYGVSALVHVTPTIQAIVELHGERVFGQDDQHALYVSPGLTTQPFRDKSISLGAGVTLPVTDDRDFDYSLNLMTIFHF
jgi:hypothetical protein